MNRPFPVLAVALVASACASDPALKKLAAAPLPWCNPCTYQTACTSPCGGPVVAAPPAPVPAPAPARPAYVPPPSPALSAAFDPTPGEYKEAQKVTLSSPTPGAVIHYTTDGSTPSAASPAYTGPIAVERDTTIRAIVTAPDVPESSISQGEYTIAPPPPPPVSSSRVTVTEKKLQLNEKIFFDSGKATIKPGSLGLLDEVAQVLTANPQVKKVLIEGHTDNVGKAELNTQLSQGRAQAVRDYLVKKGVAPDRLDAKGFGPARPVADNRTAKGREANRRVEFVIE